MPRGASPKREHEFEALKRKFHQQGRYGKRADEVAARIVNKQRAQHGETQQAQAQQEHGEAPDRKLAIAGYAHMTVGEITRHLKELKPVQMRQIKAYEQQHKARKTLLQAIDEALTRH
jgi:vacuolar-type H+-ATPase subunit I/STV1